MLFDKETFESGSTPWSFDSVGTLWGSATAALDTSGKVVGANSLAFGASGEGAAFALKTLAGDASEIFIRFKLFFPTGWSFGSSSYANFFNFQTNAGDAILGLNIEDYGAIRLVGWNSLTSTYSVFGTDFSPNSVHTLQVYFKHDTSAGRIKVWLNNDVEGSPDYDSGAINTGGTAFRRLLYGIGYIPNAHSTYYMDEMEADSAFITDVVATIEQEGFAFGADDGNEASHTLDTQDTNLTAPLGTKTLRALLNAAYDPAGKAFKLKYQKNGSGGYADVLVGATRSVTLDATVSAGADDAQQSGSTVTVTGTTIGASLDATTEYVGIRFQGITIPKGATITAAYLSVVPSGTGEDEPLVTIAGLNEDNTAAFVASANNITSRAVTTATVSWSSTDLGATGATYHNTPSLTAIVQEIIDRAGWASGNAMGFRIQGGATSTRDLTIESYENTGNNPPKLHVEYTIGNELYVAVSGNVAGGGEATTARLTAPSGKTTSDFTTGRRWDDENGSDSIDIATDDYIEVEWVLTTQAPAADDDYFEFRVYAGDAALDTYTLTPRWTIGSGGGDPPNTSNFFQFF